jgi:hypothetical protein
MTRAVADLACHLEEAYGIKVAWMTPLEPWTADGVQRVNLEGGESWVARAHGPARPIPEVHGDAETLGFLDDHDVPAEPSTSPCPPHLCHGSLASK